MPDPEKTKDDGGAPVVSQRLIDGPLVFVSHDSRDAVVAEAFCTLLSNVSAGMLQTFRSSDKKGSQGFEYGVEWYPELMKRLDVACDVVCLLTKRSLNRPWLLYEAGVAKGKLDVPVHGLALGVPLSHASIGPFAQFQNCDDEVDAVSKLIVQLVKRLPHASPNQQLVRGQVEDFLRTIQPTLLEESDDDSSFGPFADDSTAKLFEEIKVMFQDLPSRLDRLAMSPGSRRDALRRFHPALIEEIIMSMGPEGRDSGVAALVLASYLRDDFPWLLEMGAAVYDASLSGNRAVQRRAAENFARASEIALAGPLSRELRGSSVLLLEELPMMIRHFVLSTLDSGEEPVQ